MKKRDTFLPLDSGAKAAIELGGISVTQRVRGVKGVPCVQQPRGGYLPVKDMETQSFDDGHGSLDSSLENRSPSAIGTVVDYLSRYVEGASKNDAFQIPLYSAMQVKELIKKYGLGEYEVIDNASVAITQVPMFLDQINGLDDESISAALNLVAYDCIFRAGIETFRNPEKLETANQTTIQHIRRMVLRSHTFMQEYGPAIAGLETFEGGYTKVVSAGDCDLVTADGLWDFKCSKFPPTNKHTLQILMYWQMGLHSVFREYKKITQIGIWNPRIGKLWKYNVSELSQDVINELQYQVLVYPVDYH
ncbi:hypothetical protein KIMH_13310 [Bombiscardovia apis]|uniref:Uncharacterized protein n=1 Tax=Bombiscardovia apis TaxID=2932182 RepID=A0ABM8BE71_9BIFI|nr:hypothetical protein [Bombiscardovia apis]BDR55220.1 hypothetical protein KIMH_13310 [Bombiscardovia apis]